MLTEERPRLPKEGMANRLRPYSARPGSAYTTVSSRKIIGRDTRRTIPRRMIQDKEGLYDVNLHLKMQNGALQEENTRARTRVKFLEQELVKATNGGPGGRQNNSVANLKRLYHETKLTLEAREKELEDLQHTMKATVIQELQVELQVVTDECKRLKRVLEEILGQQAAGNTVELEKYFEMHGKLKEMTAEYQGLGQFNEQLQEEVVFWKAKALKNKKGGGETMETLKLKKTIEELKNKQKQSSDQNARLRDQLTVVRTGSALSTPILPEDLEGVFTDHILEKGHVGFWEYLNSSNKEIVSLKEFQDALETLGATGLDEIAKLYKKLSDGTNKLTRDHIKCYYFGMVPMQLPFRHLSKALQVKRYELVQLPVILFGQSMDKEYKPTDLEVILTSAPIELPRPIAKEIVNMVLDTTAATGNELADQIVSEMIPWKVLSESDETSFDLELAALFSPISQKFLTACKALDPNDTQRIPMSKFDSICADLRVVVPKYLKDYLELLFYTDQCELDVAPYEGFIKAYE